MSNINWSGPMAEIVIVITPSFDARSKRSNGRFDARLKGFEEIICKATHQPLLDASRVLLRKGVDLLTVICMVRSDAPTIVTMRAPIGVAAQYDVMGEKFVRRKPDAGPMRGSRIDNHRRSDSTLGLSHKGSSRTMNDPSVSPTPSSTATNTEG
jgi:hypothetical protein